MDESTRPAAPAPMPPTIPLQAHDPRPRNGFGPGKCGRCGADVMLRDGSHYACCPNCGTEAAAPAPREEGEPTYDRRPVSEYLKPSCMMPGSWQAFLSVGRALNEADGKVRRLEAEVGALPEGAHPDEAKPRAETWLAERANWAAEVESLRAEVARLRAALEELPKRVESGECGSLTCLWFDGGPYLFGWNQSPYVDYGKRVADHLREKLDAYARRALDAGGGK